MSESDQVSCSTTPIADDHWHWRLVVHVDQHCLYRVGASFDNQTHQRYGVVVLESDWKAQNTFFMNPTDHSLTTHSDETRRAYSFPRWSRPLSLVLKATRIGQKSLTKPVIGHQDVVLLKSKSTKISDLWRDKKRSNRRRKLISQPYLPTVPSSTSRK